MAETFLLIDNALVLRGHRLNERPNMTVSAAISLIQSLVGDRITQSASDLDLHGRNESHFPITPPDAVVYPISTKEVSQIAKICNENNCPIVAWGRGTSLEGHALAVRGGITIDMSRMNAVMNVSQGDMVAVVQPGITREELNEDLRATGLFFSVDPGANASIGGMTATRASGTTAVRYGTMRDNVMGLEVVLANGRIIRTGGAMRKSSAGYDMTALFVGSEGTLGIITEVTLKLHGQPDSAAAAICAFDRFEDAVDAVIATIQMGIPMARIEFVDEKTAGAFNAYAGAEMPEKPHLLVEFHGTETSAAEDAKMFGELAADFGGSDFDWATSTEDRKALWAMRHNAYYACMALRKGARGLTTDICVPISKLAEAVRITRDDIGDSPLIGPILGHVGDGNFHALLLIDPDSPKEAAEAKRISANLAELALNLGGTVTGEHGIGMGKIGYMEAEHGDAWDVMGDIKRTMDPNGIMNPGKILRPSNS